MIRLFIVTTVVFAAATTSVCAQEQEGKLMNRLLKPNMALQNGAETKQFNASRSAVTRSTPTKTFHFMNRSFAREFGGVRTVKPQAFHTSTSRFQRAQANLQTRNALPEAGAAYRTSDYNGVNTAPDAARTVSTSAYPEDQRAFLGRGKSQKSLSAQDRPLTIEEVRELLNKNK